jgi:hypothetical protein
VEGLKRAKVEPLNYSQVIVVQQGPEENPFTFLQHLKDAIRKHTTVDPESQVGEVLLKDKFLTQSAPDIHRKLQKSVAEGEKLLDQLMQVAMSVYYNQDITKGEKKTKNVMTSLQLSGRAPPDWDITKRREKDKKNHHDLIAALREGPTGLGPTS